MIDFNEFENNIKTKIPDFSLVKHGSLKLTYEPEHMNEECDEYVITYHASLPDEWICAQYLRTFRFKNNDLLILGFIDGNKTQGREFPQDQLDKIYHLIEQLYGEDHPIMDVSKFSDLMQKVAPTLALQSLDINIDYRGYAYKKYTFVDAEPNEYPFSSYKDYKGTCVAIHDQNLILLQNNEDRHVTQPDGSKVLVMGHGQHTVASTKISEILINIAKYREERIQDRIRWDNERREEQLARDKATEEGRAKPKPSIEQRKEWARAALITFAEDVKDVEFDMGSNPETIYFDCYKTDSFYDDGYEATLILSMYGNGWTDYYEWNAASEKLFAAIFPEYDIYEVMEGVFELNWKNGNVLNEEEIEEVNTILAQMPGFVQLTIERENEKV